MAPQSVVRGAPRSGNRAAAGTPYALKYTWGRQPPAMGVAFRAFHPAKPTSRRWETC
jgi:hypothetical protein